MSKSDQDCVLILERLLWGGFPRSPFSASSKVYRCKNGYKCRDTGLYFTIKTNTIFHKSKIPLSKWFQAIELLYEGPNRISTVQLAHILGLTQKSAWLMHRKITAHFGYPVWTEKSDKRIEDIQVVADDEKLNITDWLNLLKDNR